METLVYILAPICLFAIWRAEVIDERKRVDEKIRWEKELAQETLELEQGYYIAQCYREINKLKKPLRNWHSIGGK